MNALKWFSLCLALCAPHSGAGQTLLSLDSCLVLARRNSPQLRSADNAVRAAGLARSELNTTALPQLQAVIDGIYIPVPPRYGYDPAITDGGEVRALISLRQSVYDAGLRGLKADQSSIDIGFGENFCGIRRLAASTIENREFFCAIVAIFLFN